MGMVKVLRNGDLARLSIALEALDDVSSDSGSSVSFNGYLQLVATDADEPVSYQVRFSHELGCHEVVL